MSKKLSRRDFLRMGALTAAGAALAGCAPQVIEKTVVQTQVVTEKETQVVVATAEPPVVEPANVILYVGLGTGTSAEQIAIHEEIQADFNAQTDLHTIEFLTSPWADAGAKLRTLVAGGMSPDITCPIGQGGTSDHFDLWGDVQPFVDRDGYDLTPLGAQAAIMVFPTKGRVGLPLGNYPVIVYFNADLFDAVGLDYPPLTIGEPYADGDPWTYDKMVEIAKQLTFDEAGNDANAAGFNQETAVQWGWNGWDWNTHKQWPAKWGGDNTGVSADMKTAEFDDEAWLASYQFHYDTYWTWFIRATGAQAGAFYNVAGDPMGSGMIAMWENHTWMGWAFSGWTDAFNWGIAAVPVVEGFDPISPLHADGMNLLAAGTQKDASWWVMKALVEPEWADRLNKNYGAVPSHVDLGPGWVDSMAADFPDVNWATIIDAQDYPDVPQHEAWVPEFTRIMTECDNLRDRIGNEPDIDVAVAVDELNATCQTLIDTYWEEHPE